MKAQEGAKKTFSKIFNRYKYLYLLMLPGVIYYLIFHIVPLFGIVIAFQDYNMVEGFASKFIGLNNFRYLFHADFFRYALKNTLIISSLKLIVGFPVPIILALSINAVNKKLFKKITQSLSYLPNFLSWIIVYSVIEIIFDDSVGVMSDFYYFILGKNYINPITNPSTIIICLVFSAIWKGMGASSIVYLAALAGIDQQLYEAAKIDGASRTKQMIYITLPNLAPICAIVLILNVGGILSGDFEQILLFQRNNPQLIRAIQVFETYMYNQVINGGGNEYGVMAALGIFQSAVGAVLILTTNFFSKKFGYGGIW